MPDFFCDIIYVLNHSIVFMAKGNNAQTKNKNVKKPKKDKKK